MYIAARFGSAYTTGVDFIDNTMRPFKQRGTRKVSIAIQVGSALQGSILVVSCVKKEKFEPLQAGYVRLLIPERLHELRVSFLNQV